MSPVLPLTFFFPETKPSGLRKVGVVLAVLVFLVALLLLWRGLVYLANGNVVFFPTHIFLLGGIF